MKGFKRSVSVAITAALAMASLAMMGAPAQAASCITGASGASYWYLTNHCQYAVYVEIERGLLYDPCYRMGWGQTLTLGYPNQGYRVVSGC